MNRQNVLWGALAVIGILVVSALIALAIVTIEDRKPEQVCTIYTVNGTEIRENVKEFDSYWLEYVITYTDGTKESFSEDIEISCREIE